MLPLIRMTASGKNGPNFLLLLCTNTVMIIGESNTITTRSPQFAKRCIRYISSTVVSENSSMLKRHYSTTAKQQSSNTTMWQQWTDDFLSPYNQDATTITANMQYHKAVFSAICFWSKKSTPDGAMVAEKILERVFEAQQQQQQQQQQQRVPTTGARATTAMYNTILSSWASCSSIAGSSRSSETLLESSVIISERVEDLLRRMEDRFALTQDQDAKPNHMSYNIVLDVLGKQKRTAEDNNNDGVVRAQQLLRRMELDEYIVSPNVVSYNTVISALSRLKSWDAAEKSEQLLLHMTDMSISPDEISFNSVIRAWAKLSSVDAAMRAQSVLTMMLHLKHHNVHPNVISFNTVIDAFANCGQADMANETLSLMENECNSNNDDTPLVVPNIRTYNTILKSYARAGGSKWAREAETLLFKIIQGRCIGEPLTPDVSTFSSTIHAISKSGDLSNAGERAEALLDAMLNLSSSASSSSSSYNNSNTSTNANVDLAVVKPNVILFNSIITCWLRSTNRKNKEDRAESLLHRMKSLGISPDHITYQMLIHAWCQCQDMAKAERILEQMEDDFNSGNVRAAPNNFSYECFIMAWSKLISSANPSSSIAGSSSVAIQKAYDVLKRMEAQASKNNNISQVKVDTITCNLVLRMCAKGSSAGDRQASVLAVRLLTHMEDLFQSGNKDVEPDTISYTSVVTALSKNGARWRNDDASTQVEHIFKKVKCLETSGKSQVAYMDTRFYNATMDAFGSTIRGREGAQKAHDILEEMELRYQGGNNNVKPDVISYNTVLKAWAKSGAQDAAENAQNLLENMVTFAFKGDGIKPDEVSFNTVIDAWAHNKLNDAPLRAQQVIHHMIELKENGLITEKPTTKTFTGVLLAWSKSKRQDSPQRAEQLIDFMEKLHLTGQYEEVKPDTHCFTVLLDTYAKSRSSGNATFDVAARVLNILERLIREYRQGNSSLCPDATIFNTAINAAGSSNSKEKTKIVQKILQLMDEDQRYGNSKAKPDVISFNSVIKACAYTREQTTAQKKEALQLALQTYADMKMKHNVAPDHVTYGSLIKACNYLMELDDRMRAMTIIRIFRRCCEEGKVSPFVVKEMQSSSLSANELSVVFGTEDDKNGKVDFRRIPPNWKRNVLETDRSY